MPVLLCADDYGLSRGVGRAIRDLAREGRLSATSALVTEACWPDEAARLIGCKDQVAVGLHLNLTSGRPLGPMPKLAGKGVLPDLPVLIRRALLGRLDAEELRAELSRQFDRFQRFFGDRPDFVDGHQHVHVLPGIRSIVLEQLRARFPTREVLVRDPSDARLLTRTLSGARIKAGLVSALSIGFARSARMAGFAVNDSFAGFSSFGTGGAMQAEFAEALRAPATGLHLVMCHPGCDDAAAADRDDISERRIREYDCLRSMVDLPGQLWRPGRALRSSPVLRRAEPAVPDLAGVEEHPV